MYLEHVAAGLYARLEPPWWVSRKAKTAPFQRDKADSARGGAHAALDIHQVFAGDEVDLARHIQPAARPT